MALVTDAGGFGFVVLGLGGLGLVVVLLLAGIGLTKRRVPLAVWVMLPFLVAAVGAIGAWLGVGNVVAAMANAEPGTKVALAVAGLGQALAPDALGRWVAAGLFVASACAAGLGALVGAAERRWTVIAGLVAGIATLLGTAGVAAYAFVQGLGAGGYLLAGLLLVGGLGVATGAMRRALDDGAQRVAAMRFASGILLLFAIGYAGTALVMGAKTGLYAAATGSSPELAAAMAAQVTATSTLAWIAFLAAVVVAFCGFFSELGDVVQRGTLLDVMGTLVLMAMLGGVRSLEGTRVDMLRDIATLAPVQGLFEKKDPSWPGPPDLPVARVMVGGESVSAPVIAPAFGDMVVRSKGQWVRLYAWTGRGWTEDGSKLADVDLEPTLPALVVAGFSEMAPALLEVLDRSPGGALLLARQKEVDANAPPEMLPQFLTSIPLQRSAERDLGRELWVEGHSLQLFRGPVRYWGAGAAEKPAARLDAALAETGSPGVHFVVTSRTRVADLVEGCVPALVKVGAGSVTPRSAFCTLLDEEVETLREEAAAKAGAPKTDAVSLWLDVSGELDKARLEAVLEREKGALAWCADRARAEKQDASGRLVLDVAIDKRGGVASLAENRRNQLGSEVLRACVEERLEAAPLPEAGGEEPATVTLAVAFR